MKKQKSVSIESVIARIDAALESNTDATEPTPLATAPGPLAKNQPPSDATDTQQRPEPYEREVGAYRSLVDPFLAPPDPNAIEIPVDPSPTHLSEVAAGMTESTAYLNADIVNMIDSTPLMTMAHHLCLRAIYQIYQDGEERPENAIEIGTYLDRLGALLETPRAENEPTLAYIARLFESLGSRVQ